MTDKYGNFKFDYEANQKCKYVLRSSDRNASTSQKEEKNVIKNIKIERITVRKTKIVRS